MPRRKCFTIALLVTQSLHLGLGTALSSAADPPAAGTRPATLVNPASTWGAAPLPPTRLPMIRQTQFIDDGPFLEPILDTGGDESIADHTSWQADTLPIDLTSALGLAGANSLQIAFAAERLEQALARVSAADALWVPSLNVGAIYNNHAGRIQATDGSVVEVSRNSVFVGAGAGVGRSPLNGGSGGPARMFVDLPLVDVIFEPLAARQSAQAADADQATTFNDALLAAGVAYFDLVKASGSVGVANEAVANAEELATLTEDFARSGQGLQADADRAQAELFGRKREVLAAQETVAVASAELARQLRLDPATQLAPVDEQPVQLDLVEPHADVYDLIGQACALRPELIRTTARLDATWYRLRQERWRPLMPHLYAGFSGGGFGGAPSSNIDNFSDRTDFDVAAIWQLENLGLGNRARQREQESLHRQSHLAVEAVRDQVAAEVTQSYQQVHFRGKQISATVPQVRFAAAALKRNLEGIRGGVVRPIEIQQAIGALANARRQHLEAVVGYNNAQLALLRAIGQPPAGEGG